MVSFNRTKTLLLISLVVLVFSVALAVLSVFPTYPGGNQSDILVNNTFKLSPTEVYRQGLGSFHTGETILLSVQCPTAFQKNFSIMFPFTSYVITNSTSCYSISTSANITYTFNADSDYYEAVFVSNSSTAGTIHFEASIEQPKSVFPFMWLNEASKITFILSLSVVMFLTLRMMFSTLNSKRIEFDRLSLSKKNRKRLLVLLLLSLIVWLSVIALNSNQLGTFENWYTDHARHSYVSSLFLKDGFSVFDQPLGKLSNSDNSYYKYVTWPEMPHIYPLGSIFLFMPFGVLIQNGFNPTAIYKIEIGIFLVFATVCLYFFFKGYLKKNMNLFLKLLGVYIIYVSLIVYAADGMFDSVAFLFSLFAISMFVAERYDYFVLLMSISIFVKYQAGIFLLPLIVVGLIKLFQQNRLSSLVKNKFIIASTALVSVSAFTAYLSVPYILTTAPQLIMNGANAFLSNSQIAWPVQSFSILLTLGATLAYALYMLKRNSLLSLSAFFLLFPIFTLPYSQNWYFPFLFAYVLLPQRKKELEATMLWLILLILVLAISGANYQPIPLIAQYFQNNPIYFHSPMPHLPPSVIGF